MVKQVVWGGGPVFRPPWSLARLVTAWLSKLCVCVWGRRFGHQAGPGQRFVLLQRSCCEKFLNTHAQSCLQSMQWCAQPRKLTCEASHTSTCEDNFPFAQAAKPGDLHSSTCRLKPAGPRLCSETHPFQHTLMTCVHFAHLACLA